MVPSVGEIGTHIMVNSLENNILADYDPYQTPNASGDVEKAKEEMALSAYDTDGDGVCDAPECKDILTITDREDPYPDQMALLKQFLEPIGLTLDDKQLERGTMYNQCNDANSHHRAVRRPGLGQGLRGRHHVRRALVHLPRSVGELLQLLPVGRNVRSTRRVGLRRERGRLGGRSGVRRAQRWSPVTNGSSAGRSSTSI